MEHEIINSNVSIFSEILKRLERAGRNGARAHLDHEHARALLTSRVFMVLNELKQEEMKREWQEEVESERTVSSSGVTGSGIDQTATTGASVGSMGEPLAAGVSASAAALRIIRQKKRKSP